jgi:hypothetical protein
MEPSMRRLRAEDENGRLKKLLAETDAGQRHAARHQPKKWRRPLKRAVAHGLWHQVSRQRGGICRSIDQPCDICRVVAMTSMYEIPQRPENDVGLVPPHPCDDCGGL